MEDHDADDEWADAYEELKAAFLGLEGDLTGGGQNEHSAGLVEASM
jgi:hypothetical protein